MNFPYKLNKFFPQTLNVSPVVLGICWKPHKIRIHICSCYITELNRSCKLESIKMVLLVQLCM